MTPSLPSDTAPPSRSHAQSPTSTTKATAVGAHLFEEHTKAWAGRSWVQAFLIPLLLAAAMTVLLPTLLTFALNPLYSIPEPFTLGTVGAMIITTPLFVFLIVKISKVSLRDLGYISIRWLRTWGAGMIAGFLAASTVVGIAALSGTVNVQLTFDASRAWLLLVALVFFLFQGMSEEITYRLYLMPAFASKVGPFLAIAISSALFTAVHLGNPNSTALGMFNILLYGVFFGVLYWRFGNAWLVAGYHTAWNFTLSMLYGSSVSGVPTPGSVLTSAPAAGGTLLSGGDFGLEGSVLTTAVGLLIIGWCLYTKPIKPRG